MYIGIDYGTKRVGLAVSDEGNAVAFPLEVVGEKDALARVVALVRERRATGVVIGESKDLSGHDNPVMGKIRTFVAALGGAASVPIVFEPEFMTSAAAAQQYTPTGNRKANPSQEKLDASAAALILQNFLDRMSHMDSAEANTEEKQKRRALSEQSAPASEEEDAAPALISIDDFHRADIRIGEIVSAEKVEKADKLLQLMVSFGPLADGTEEVRQIVSGIALYFADSASLVGRHVAFVYNLQPRVIRGLESQGMILAASVSEDSIALLEAPAAPAGARVG